MPQMQIFNKCLNTKKYRSLGGNFYRILNRQYESNRIVPDSSFSKNAWNRNKIRAFNGNL